jgi:hypothetical protein
VKRVAVYHAPGCHLCERAIEVVRRVRSEVAFELELIDVSGDAELETRYRERLPVVEVEGAEAFTYFVAAERLRTLVR